MLNIKANQARKFHKKSYGKLRRKHTLFPCKTRKDANEEKKIAKEHKKRESWKEMALSGCKA